MTAHDQIIALTRRGLVAVGSIRPLEPSPCLYYVWSRTGVKGTGAGATPDEALDAALADFDQHNEAQVLAAQRCESANSEGVDLGEAGA